MLKGYPRHSPPSLQDLSLGTSVQAESFALTLPFRLGSAMQPYAYILTGGKSRRFGGDDKALALLGGQTLVERTAQLIEPQCQAVTLVANRPGTYADLHYPVIVDRFPNVGPLGGIDSALNHVGDTGWTFICPCDLSYVGKNWLEILIKHAGPTSDAVVFQGDRFEPLFTLYHSRILPLVEEHIREKRLAPHHLFPKIQSVVLPLPPDWPAEPSFNTRESLDAFKD